MGALSVLGSVLMTYKEFSSKYKSIKPCYKPNKLDFPENLIPTTEEGMVEFNEIMDFIHELVETGEIYGREMGLTKSGGIKKTPLADHQNTYAIIVSNSMIEVLLCYKDYYRFHFRRKWVKEKSEMSGSRSFYLFKKTLEKFGVDLEEMRVSHKEGLMYKDMIPSPIIDVNEDIIDKTLENVHHLDIHSAHMAGMAEGFESLREPIEFLYNKRKEQPKYKSVLTHTWGFCQSKYVDFGFSHLSLAGIRSTNRKIKDLTKRLKESGREPIMWNTDGIWYSGEIYHGEGEGNLLGQWSNDHTNCKFRAKSKGTYEYIEDGKYTPVARGPREFEKIKPREEWEWGDIYRAEKVLSFIWNDDEEKLYKESKDENLFNI